MGYITEIKELYTELSKEKNRINLLTLIKILVITVILFSLIFGSIIIKNALQGHNVKFKLALSYLYSVIGSSFLLTGKPVGW